MRIPDETKVVERGQDGDFRWIITENVHNELAFVLHRNEAMVECGKVLDGNLRDCNAFIREIIDRLSREDSEMWPDRSKLAGWKSRD